MKEWKYNDNSDEDIINEAYYDGSLSNIKESGRNKKFGSTNALSSLASGEPGSKSGKTENKIEYNVNQMQDRASQNRSFVYIKIPGAHHCISYKGPKDKNIYDIFQFTFKFPTLEYRNKTWSWYEFLMAVKKDLTRTVINHVASLMKEKIFKRKLNEKEANKMFGMLDEQIMYKFKKYYKNKGSTSANTSTTSFSGNGTLSEMTYDSINYIPEENEEELNMKYVEELQNELFNDQDGDITTRSDTYSKESLGEVVDRSSTPNSLRKSKSKQSQQNVESKTISSDGSTSPKKQKSAGLSMELVGPNFPMPMREGNSRNNVGIISGSIHSINSFSTVSSDYNEYMFIKKRMLFGKYMDDK